MDKQAVIRRVRIAVSVFFGVVTLAIMLHWVRSQWRHDVLGIFTGGTSAALFGSADGVLCLELCDEFGWRHDDPVYFVRTMAVRSAWPWHGETPTNAPGGFLIKRYPGSTYFVIPHWFAIAFAGIPAAAFANPRSLQFSLRTMLIAATLLAVVLGLGVWLAR
jgi:hypothetical protein